jgi:rSAM/selenodomain-associated transferase 2
LPADVSIIIPTWNEAAGIAGTIAALRGQVPAEIIVADGGSTDATVKEAHGADRVLLAPPGRAAQMNAGAAVAGGDTLLFLHADCTLAPGAVAAARACLERDVIAGCFSMRVTAGGLAYRAIDACATARVRLTGIAYGDQGLFVRRRDFDRLGGFPTLRFMEDVFFSRTLRAHGRVVVLPHAIHVSPRRWQRVGLVRQTLRNWTLTALALAGVPPDRLAAYYPRVR